MKTNRLCGGNAISVRSFDFTVGGWTILSSEREGRKIIQPLLSSHSLCPPILLTDRNSYRRAVLYTGSRTIDRGTSPYYAMEDHTVSTS